MTRRDALATNPVDFVHQRRAEEPGLLRMRSECLISAVRCNWFHGIDRLVAIAFRIIILIAAIFVGAATGHAQVETNDPGIVSGTLARIKTTGTVRLGYRDASIPFSYL